MAVCVVSDALPWVQLMADRLKHWQTHDILISKSAALDTVFVEVVYVTDVKDFAKTMSLPL